MKAFFIAVIVQLFLLNILSPLRKTGLVICVLIASVSFAYAEIPSTCVKAYQSKNITPNTASCLNQSYLTGMCSKYRNEYCGVSCGSAIEEYEATEQKIVRAAISELEQKIITGIVSDVVQALTETAVTMNLPLGDLVLPAKDMMTASNSNTARSYAELYTSQLKALPKPLREGFTELMIDGLTGLQGDANKRAHKTHKEEFLDSIESLDCSGVTLPDYEETE